MPAKRRLDIVWPRIGDVYDKWTVEGGPTEGCPSQRKWWCRCECGNYRWVQGYYLVMKKSTRCRSCGIVGKDNTPLHAQLGISRELCKRLYKAAWSAVDRCTNKSNKVYDNYGGRGISVCSEWISNTRLFVEHLLTLVGHNDFTLYLDRVNNDGNYELGNLRFVSPSESSANQRPRKEGCRRRFFGRQYYGRRMK